MDFFLSMNNEQLLVFLILSILVIVNLRISIIEIVKCISKEKHKKGETIQNEYYKEDISS